MWQLLPEVINLWTILASLPWYFSLWTSGGQFPAWNAYQSFSFPDCILIDTDPFISVSLIIPWHKCHILFITYLPGSPFLLLLVETQLCFYICSHAGLLCRSRVETWIPWIRSAIEYSSDVRGSIMGVPEGDLSHSELWKKHLFFKLFKYFFLRLGKIEANMSFLVEMNKSSWHIEETKKNLGIW